LKKRTRTKGIGKYILNDPTPERIVFIGEFESENPNAELYVYRGKMTICEENFSLNAN
jgi:hypothetical protein